MEREVIMSGLIDEKKSLLLANRCISCHQTYFPPMAACTECGRESMETVPLGSRGRLYTYTVSYMDAMHAKAPYAMGYVEMPEGVRVFALLDDWKDKELKVGMEVELVLDVLWTEDGKEIFGYKFRVL